MCLDFAIGQCLHSISCPSKAHCRSKLGKSDATCISKRHRDTSNNQQLQQQPTTKLVSESMQHYKANTCDIRPIQSCSLKHAMPLKTGCDISSTQSCSLEQMQDGTLLSKADLLGSHVLQLEQLFIGSSEFHILIHQLIHSYSQGLTLCLLSET